MEAPSMLHYIVELGAAGICDGAPNGMTPAERLSRSWGTQGAWKSSTWISMDNFPHLRELLPYALTTSGNLVVSRGSRNRTGELVLILFPSESRGISEYRLSVYLGHNRLEVSCADDSQNLVVYSWFDFFSTVFPFYLFTSLEHAFVSLSTIHIRTLSTGVVHPPLTKHTGPIHSRVVSGSRHMRICGNRFLVLGCSPHPWSCLEQEDARIRRPNHQFPLKHLRLKVADDHFLSIIDTSL